MASEGSDSPDVLLPKGQDEWLTEALPVKRSFAYKGYTIDQLHSIAILSTCSSLGEQALTRPPNLESVGVDMIAQALLPRKTRETQLQVVCTPQAWPHISFSLLIHQSGA